MKRKGNDTASVSRNGTFWWKFERGLPFLKWRQSNVLWRRREKKREGVEQRGWKKKERAGVSGKRLGEKDTTKAIYISKVIIWLELKARDDF